MKNKQEMNMLYRVARMYYEQDMTQNEIAKEIGANRTNISRMLKKMREKDIVQIRINYDAFRDIEIEEKLKERYDLKEIIIVPSKQTESKEHRLAAIGQACANYLNQIIQKNDVVGFSWGSSLAAVVEAWHPTKDFDLMCVPLIGGPDGKLSSRYYANTIVYEVARKTKGHSKLIDFPAIVQTADLKKALTDSEHFREIEGLWEQLQIAIVGIGSPLINDGPNWLGFYGERFDQALKDGRVVGDICSNFYDESGHYVETELIGRTISIDLAQLKQANYTIGVAESPEKVAAIQAALTAGYLNVLVTTEETAYLLLSE
ncbi:sugar-binding transcriptional regulator [Exiguobacterium sp. SL14]|nr:sugar-binding transcriptional regulator [Exiguobacterium sp. SL14]MCY1689756.1 sugar-binding transcriptional regulator [Exiguobacterium sp. SL14]